MPNVDARTLGRIRKLLTRSEHPATPPAEAQACSAAAIGARLREVQEDTERAAASSAPGTALVLVDRKAQVDAAFAEKFPRIRTMRPSVSSGNGLTAGQRAGVEADLSMRRSRLNGQ